MAKPRAIYRPSTETQKLRESVYKDIHMMLEQRNRTYPQFNGSEGDRTLKQYINDSDRRLNGYTLTRDEQDKEDWQANVFNPVTREKLKAVVAGVAQSAPELQYTAVNRKGVYSGQRAEFIKQLVRHSRELSNPQLDIFFEAWEACGKGTSIKYDGYLKTKYKRKFIKSFDLDTGKVEFDERDETVDDRPVDISVPITELFIWDFTIFDIQEQPKIAWIQHYDRATLEMEFGHLPNFKYIRDKQSFARRFHSDTISYFYDKWATRVKNEDDYEVVRYYNKFEDRYEIWVNGIDMLIAPLLWGKAKKLYPFSKTIFEPFIDKNFFYGKSLPSVLEGNQDVNNAVWNTMLDKLYRSLTPPMLVGLPNKDLLDIEDELVNQDNKLYVPDVNQVKPMPYDGVTQGDIAMLQAVSRMLDLASVDANQSGIQGRGVSAHEVQIAAQNADRLKGIFFTMLEDLWMQKTRIRIENILLNYMQPRYEAVIGKDGTKSLQEAFTMFHVKNVKFSDGTTGTLGVHIAKDKNSQMTREDVQVREMAAQGQGINYKAISATSDYLDDWDFDFVLEPESLFRTDKKKEETDFLTKLQTEVMVFPEYLASNKDKRYDEFLSIYGENIDDMNPPAKQDKGLPQDKGQGQGRQPSPLAQGANALGQ